MQLCKPFYLHGHVQNNPQKLPVLGICQVPNYMACVRWANEDLDRSSELRAVFLCAIMINTKVLMK